MTVCASCSALICETRYQRTLSSQLSNYTPQNKENTRKLGCLRFIVTGLKWTWRYVFFRVSVKISTVHDVTPGKHVILRLHRKIACELNMAYRPHVIQLHALTCPSQKKKKGPGKIWMIYWISSPHFRQVKKIAECHVRKHVTTGKEALCTRVNLNYACVWLHNNHMTAYSAQPRNRLLSLDPWGLVGSGYVTMLRTVLFL